MHLGGVFWARTAFLDFLGITEAVFEQASRSFSQHALWRRYGSTRTHRTKCCRGLRLYEFLTSNLWARTG